MGSRRCSKGSGAEQRLRQGRPCRATPTAPALTQRARRQTAAGAPPGRPAVPGPWARAGLHIMPGTEAASERVAPVRCARMRSCTCSSPAPPFLKPQGTPQRAYPLPAPAQAHPPAPGSRPDSAAACPGARRRPTGTPAHVRTPAGEGTQARGAAQGVAHMGQVLCSLCSSSLATGSPRPPGSPQGPGRIAHVLLGKQGRCRQSGLQGEVGVGRQRSWWRAQPTLHAGYAGLGGWNLPCHPQFSPPVLTLYHLRVPFH